MCGITGIIGPDSEHEIGSLTDRLTHRGPDGRGTWTNSDRFVSLGHRRLSVIDTSESGQQPMLSSDGRWCIVFNGEIYNFTAIRAEIKGVSFRSSSDTEVLVESIAQFGFRQTLSKLNGMFAFAVIDNHLGELHLARDRMGEKPLYYGVVDDRFLFSSELKGISAHPRFTPDINRDALALFLRYNCIPAPHTIYHGIQKLSAASCLTIKLSDDGSFRQSEPQLYWDLSDVVAGGIASPLDVNDAEAIERLESQIESSVASRMVSDVPLGAFLSGGYDSTLVVAMMQKQSPLPVRTFSIGMNEDGYNEAVHARAVAQHLGTDHTELYISPADAQAIIPELPRIYCEPFADPSQVPTYLVSRLARQHVTVALSGDGGDELFGGYNRHFWAKRIWRRLSYFPLAVRNRFAKIVKLRSAERWNRSLASLSRIASRPGDKLHKLAGVAHANSEMQLYHLLTSNCQDPQQWVAGSCEPDDLITNETRHPEKADFSDLMMYLDSVTYLSDDILTKVDRASMAVSLEARVPLLDHELVEFAWRLPQRMKIRDGEGKWILKQIVHRHVPESIMRRPKMGFGMPIDQWLRGPLRSWADDLLDRDRLQAEGFFHAERVRQLFDRHVSGKEQLELQLWSLLMFQSWYEKQNVPTMAA